MFYELIGSHAEMGLRKGTIVRKSDDYMYGIVVEDTRRTGFLHTAVTIVNGDGCNYSVPVSMLKAICFPK